MSVTLFLMRCAAQIYDALQERQQEKLKKFIREGTVMKKCVLLPTAQCRPSIL